MTEAAGGLDVEIVIDIAEDSRLQITKDDFACPVESSAAGSEGKGIR